MQIYKPMREACLDIDDRPLLILLLPSEPALDMSPMPRKSKVLRNPEAGPLLGVLTTCAGCGDGGRHFLLRAVRFGEGTRSMAAEILCCSASSSIPVIVSLLSRKSKVRAVDIISLLRFVGARFSSGTLRGVIAGRCDFRGVLALWMSALTRLTPGL